MNSKKENVLVFSGATYPAMQIIDCLKHSLRFNIIAAASYPNHSEFVLGDTINNLPFVNEEGFIPAFIKLINDKSIKYVIPTDDTIAMVLMEHEKDIPAKIVCSPYETTMLCRFKSKAYDFLKGESYIPLVYDNKNIKNIVDYPVFVKPDNSQGSRGARMINSFDELSKVDNINEMVICEYLPGEEYTVDCFTDKKGNLIFCNPRERTRVMNGITARGEDVPCTKEFYDVINGLNSAIHFRGYWFAQLKRDKNRNLKLLEICTRFAGTFAISKGKGVNLPLLALCDQAELPTDVIENDYSVICDKTYIDRYRIGIKYNQVFIDYDDTITCNNGLSINPYIIAYLYQCKQKGKKITLITRHYVTFGEKLLESFAKLRICPNLFDEIIELQWDEKKAEKISCQKNAIFIDNSFAERKAVKEKVGIPVFDVCNVDALFDWRD